MSIDVKTLVDALAAAAPDPPLRLRQGVVVSLDGTTLTVTIGGSDTSVSGIKYLASYTPRENDAVWLATDGRDWMVIGKLADGTDDTGFGNLDGGEPHTNFGGYTAVDGGSV